MKVKAILFTLGLLLMSMSIALAAPDWSGEWNTDFDKLIISQQGNQVTGNYGWEKGRIQGQVIGNKLTGTWAEAPTYLGPKDAGTFEFTMNQTGDAFTGIWKYADGTTSSKKPYWNGKRNLQSLTETDAKMVKATITNSILGSAILNPGFIVVPAGKTAYNFSGSGWNLGPYGEHNGEYFGIKNMGDQFVFEHFAAGQERPVAFSQLMLGPGSYKLIVNGSAGSEANITYYLK